MYTIENDGDIWEKRFHPRLFPFFPNYDEFWRTVIVPMTMRDIDGTIDLRPNVDRDLELLAMSHYSCYCHLGVAHELLELVAEKPYLYDDLFFHIDASVEMVTKRFLKYCDKVWKKVNPSQKHQSIEGKLGYDWRAKESAFKDWAQEVICYRNAMTHDPKLGQVVSSSDQKLWIPKYDKLCQKHGGKPTNDLTWSEVRAFSFDIDFVRLNELADHFLHDVPTKINDLWPKLTEEFSKLSTLDTYQQLARIGPYKPTKSQTGSSALGSNTGSGQSVS
jgi:hypothetical protein